MFSLIPLLLNVNRELWNNDEGGYFEVWTYQNRNITKYVARHWVVLTGLSSPWSPHSDSSLNWVRLNNPFNNQVEYYPWGEFDQSLRAASPEYNILEVFRPRMGRK